MKAALLGYTRYAGHYRAYMTVQALCWGVGTLLVAAGVYFLVGSVPQRQVENFQSSYNQYCRVLESGNSRDASVLAIEILSDNTYTDILEDNPKILCAMLHETGSAYFDQEEYGTRQDRLNLAAVQLTQERYNACRETLRALETEYPDDFEVLTELAVVNSLQGETEAAGRYLSRAEEAWQEMSDEQRSNVPEELREQFEELRKGED